MARSFGNGFSFATANLMASSSLAASKPACYGVRRCQSNRSGKYADPDVWAPALETSTSIHTRQPAIRCVISVSWLNHCFSVRLVMELYTIA
jgi:hypothetical protein